MHVFGLNIPHRVHQLSSQELSREAKQRLKILDWYHAHEEHARLTCRHFGISPDTFYRWKRRYDPRALTTLESRTHRPRRRRQPTWSSDLAAAVCQLRTENPRWGKEKLAALLHAQGWEVCVSMVGRILTQLKATGQLQEPLSHAVSAHKRRLRRPYAVRKPKDYTIAAPGDLVQVDTVDLRPLPGVVLKQFTAIDVVSRWSVVGVRTRATALTATQFLDDLQARYPYALRAIQVDGGSEFMADFEAACQARGLRLFVLPPHSPKLNGCVERANRTHTEEFWECYAGDLDLPTAQAALLSWEHRYNTVRPHQALGYLTPAQFLQQFDPS